MMIRRAMIMTMVAVWAFVAHAAPSFHTALHARIAAAVGLELPADMGADVCIDSVGLHHGHALRIKTNTFGDVSHIGYRLFASDVSNSSSSVIFDFIERYALELDLRLDGRTPAERLSIDKVVCSRGNISMLRLVTPDTPFSLEEIERRMYRIGWTLPSGELRLTIPADCQLLKGANSIELEQIFERDVKRMPLIPEDAVINDWSQAKVSRSGEFLIAEGGEFLSNSIRSDIYLREKKGKRSLVADKTDPLRSVRNILLTGFTSGLTDGEIPVKLTVECYGNKSSMVSVNYRRLLGYMRTEGCLPYLGIKARNDSLVSATLFAPNKALACCHVLSIKFPLSILSTGKGEISATLYAYIPLHNVTEEFFTKDIKIYNQ